VANNDGPVRLVLNVYDDGTIEQVSDTISVGLLLQIQSNLQFAIENITVSLSPDARSKQVLDDSEVMHAR